MTMPEVPGQLSVDDVNLTYATDRVIQLLDGQHDDLYGPARRPVIEDFIVDVLAVLGELHLIALPSWWPR